jgi:hypothetical protein
LENRLPDPRGAYFSATEKKRHSFFALEPLSGQDHEHSNQQDVAYELLKIAINCRSSSRFGRADEWQGKDKSGSKPCDAFGNRCALNGLAFGESFGK